jgi:glycosyltransferase involved in cell wall biosynthesis
MDQNERKKVLKPRVSVVLPARLAQETIADSCRSVLSQDFEDIELIVVVNGPIDKTPEIVLSLGDGRIKLTESDEGIVPALNRGLALARGEIIARQDADDVWLPGKMSRQVAAFDSGLGNVIGTQMKVVQKGNQDSVTEYPLAHEEILGWFGQVKNPIGHPSVAYKRSVIDRVGGYWDFFPFAEDFDLWMRMLPYARFANLDAVGVQYNFTPNPRYSHDVPRYLIKHYASLYRAQ